MQLYPHQKDVLNKALPILEKYKVVYLIMEVRTGKTLVSLTLADTYLKRIFGQTEFNTTVCFITKKKAIPSIEADFKASGFTYKLIVTNYESLHNLNQKIHIWIIDEAHSCGQYPKPSQRTKDLKERINGAPCILLSGTPTPESFSQIYHQLDITGNSPFHHKNFYEWAKAGFVNIKQKMIGGFRINDYSRANDDVIKKECDHLFVSCSQVDAGFTCDVIETFQTVTMNEVSKFLFKSLEKDQVVVWKDVTIIADTPANELNKFAQICGGTVIQDEHSFIFDDSKAVFIRENYKGKRLAIYYRYKAELTLLESFFPKNTKSWVDFESGLSDIFLSQIQSGREGISLRSADFIIMYNIDFSATSYWQVRARMQYKDRSTPANVVWLFSDLGIEEKIYKAVSNKKNFTVSYYKKITNVRVKSTNANKKEAQGVGLASGQNNELFSPWLAGSDGTEKREDNIHRGESAGQGCNATATGKARPNTCSWL
jgi:SNF2-related domain